MIVGIEAFTWNSTPGPMSRSIGAWHALFLQLVFLVNREPNQFGPCFNATQIHASLGTWPVGNMHSSCESPSPTVARCATVDSRQLTRPPPGRGRGGGEGGY